ncbi:5921_t:CDS:2, partial [Ambispora gerdemannii]
FFLMPVKDEGDPDYRQKEEMRSVVNDQKKETSTTEKTEQSLTEMRSITEGQMQSIVGDQLAKQTNPAAIISMQQVEDLTNLLRQKNKADKDNQAKFFTELDDKLAQRGIEGTTNVGNFRARLTILLKNSDPESIAAAEKYLGVRLEFTPSKEIIRPIRTGIGQGKMKPFSTKHTLKFYDKKIRQTKDPEKKKIWQAYRATKFAEIRKEKAEQRKVKTEQKIIAKTERQIKNLKTKKASLKRSFHRLTKLPYKSTLSGKKYKYKGGYIKALEKEIKYLKSLNTLARLSTTPKSRSAGLTKQEGTKPILSLPRSLFGELKSNVGTTLAKENSNAGSSWLRTKKKMMNKEKIIGGNSILNSQQQLIKKLVSQGQNVCFTGPAGTGKSFLLRELITLCQTKYGKNKVGITATTGTGAAVIGGTTLASYFGLRADSHLEPEIVLKRILTSRSAYARQN